MSINFERWLAGLIGDDTRRTASSKSGMSESTLSRQLSRGKLSPEMVIALCRAYDRGPAQGLAETGYLEPHEVVDLDMSVASSLRGATNKQILDEILRRSDPEALHLFSPREHEGKRVIGLSKRATEQARRAVHEADELAARRRKAERERLQDEAFLNDLMARGVADSSPDELFPGDDGYSDGA